MPRDFTHRACLQLEPLEPRWAPATRVSATELTYQNIDGLIATVKFSNPILTSDAVANSVFTFSSGPGAVNGNNDTPERLWEIDLTTAAGAKGTAITVTGSAPHVGFIDATGIDLGKVELDGDLGRISAGDSKLKTPGVKALLPTSMGTQGLASQAPGGNLLSTIVGPVNKIVVVKDLKDVHVSIAGGTKGDIGLVDVAGSLIGGSERNSGRIETNGTIGEVRFGLDVLGGGGQSSGTFFAGEKFGDITIGRNLTGGTGLSAEIFTNGNIGNVVIGGTIRGGDSGGNPSGVIITQDGKIKSLQVGGSIIGGGGFLSGRIDARRGLGFLTMGGDLIGASGSFSGRVESAFGSIGDVSIGSIFAGTGNGSGSIAAGKKLGNVTIRGHLMGTSDDRVVISAGGMESTKAKIGNISIGLEFAFADILSGYNTTLFGPTGRSNADARIGSVSVGQTWTASNLVAGVDRGADGLFGSADDGTTIAGSSKFISKIGPITIGGTADGTAAHGDRYGIVAEQVASLSVNGAPAPLQTGPFNDLDVSLGTTGDFILDELQA